jgi:hypothetical protein
MQGREKEVSMRRVTASEFMSLDKHVVSTTLEGPPRVEQFDADQGERRGEVLELKSLPGQDILIFGSADIVNALMRHDLTRLRSTWTGWPRMRRATTTCSSTSAWATRVRPDLRVLGVVTTFVSSDAVAMIMPGSPSPGAHQEAPSSAAQRSLRHASASTESLPTSSPAEGRSRTSPTACPA